MYVPAYVSMSVGLPSREYVYACLVAWFRSCQAALASEDDRAVIARYLASDGLAASS
ncbi:hypothetical protein [Thermoactinospora rubra]|uniref:hypothetical protein n=1 Tax=Thermoactinospora rubra TaxID=1088767 RepID=UPI001301A2DF|nr:hypothetical protein [Thermoactinospora rubra]